MQISSFQYRMTYDLYIAAFAGAGITLLALVSDCASTRVNLAARPQWGTTIVLWHMWLSDGQSVGGEASQASMTDDSCTIALCSSFSADKDVRIMLSCLVLSTHANSAAIISCFQPVSLLRLSYVTLDKLWTFSSSKQVTHMSITEAVIQAVSAFKLIPMAVLFPWIVEFLDVFCCSLLFWVFLFLLLLP